MPTILHCQCGDVTLTVSLTDECMGLRMTESTGEEVTEKL